MRLNLSEIEDLNRSNLLTYNSRASLREWSSFYYHVPTVKSRYALKLLAISTTRQNLTDLVPNAL
jgi:hypothetical protein